MLRHTLFGSLSRGCSALISHRSALQKLSISTALLPDERNEYIIDESKQQLGNEFRKTHSIQLRNCDSSDDRYLPIVTFDSVPFSAELKKILLRQGFTTPTPTQAQSWPIALLKRDIISIAKTGSGKTCGFLLPAFQRLLATRKSTPSRWGSAAKEKMKLRAWGDVHPRKSPSVLILAPTRELAIQIENEAQKFSKNCRFETMCVYGGSSKGPQIRRLNHGVDILVATPGRCNDLADMGALRLSSVEYLVLDEADRMLDMGFEPQIRAIIEQLPEERQNLFFSATWPREVQSLASEFLKDPVQINIGGSDDLTANKDIKQEVIVLKEYEKRQKLPALLQGLQSNPEDPNSIPKTIIFVSRKSDCDDLADHLFDLGYKADSLHGDKSQMLREKTMDRFRSGRVRVLVATDVASRGLDVRDIDVVVNYDFPVGTSGVESYVHRIGRTGRGGNVGVAYTFFTNNDRDRAKELISLMKRSEQV
jgi:ATP-dependent RNA helicase DDX5/DBP2